MNNREPISREQIVNTIRLIALTCKSKDVFSCEFGNEFADRVRAWLDETVFKEIDDLVEFSKFK